MQAWHEAALRALHSQNITSTLIDAAILNLIPEADQNVNYFTCARDTIQRVRTPLCLLTAIHEAELALPPLLQPIERRRKAADAALLAVLALSRLHNVKDLCNQKILDCKPVDLSILPQLIASLGEEEADLGEEADLLLGEDASEEEQDASEATSSEDIFIVPENEFIPAVSRRAQAGLYVVTLTAGEAIPTVYIPIQYRERTHMNHTKILFTPMQCELCNEDDKQFFKDKVRQDDAFLSRKFAAEQEVPRYPKQSKVQLYYKQTTYGANVLPHDQAKVIARCEHSNAKLRGFANQYRGVTLIELPEVIDIQEEYVPQSYYKLLLIHCRLPDQRMSVHVMRERRAFDLLSQYIPPETAQMLQENPCLAPGIQYSLDLLSERRRNSIEQGDNTKEFVNHLQSEHGLQIMHWRHMNILLPPKYAEIEFIPPDRMRTILRGGVTTISKRPQHNETCYQWAAKYCNHFVFYWLSTQELQRLGLEAEEEAKVVHLDVDPPRAINIFQRLQDVMPNAKMYNTSVGIAVLQTKVADGLYQWPTFYNVGVEEVD